MNFCGSRRNSTTSANSSLASSSLAAAPHLWSARFGGTSNDVARAVAVDASGNIFITGIFNGTADFGGGGFNSAGGTDIFVVKYDPAGNHVWSKRFGDTGADAGRGIAVDGSGNVVVTGYFTGTVNFGGSNLVTIGLDDVFIARFDTNGNHLWSRQIGSTGTDNGLAVTTDLSDNMIVTGFFSSTAEFGQATASSPLTSAGITDAFVAAYSPAGLHLWSRRLGGTNEDEGLAICVVSGSRIVVTGDFWGTGVFGDPLNPLTSAGLNDIFVTQYDLSGNYQWSARYGGIGNDYGYAVASVPGGGFVLAGGFSFATNFGGGTFSSAGGRDIFFARFTTANAHVWSKGFGSGGDDYAFGVAVDASGFVAVTGGFQSPVDFGGGPVVSMGFQDVFIARYDASGVHQWDQTGGDGSTDLGYGVAVDAPGNVVATGYFRTSIDLGGGTLNELGGQDIFVAKYSAPGTPVAVSRRFATLGQNHPNPFNPSTTIEYSIAREVPVVLGIYDATGRLVAQLDQGVRAAGAHRVVWDGRDGRGRPVASGVYVYRIEGASDVMPRKMVLLK